MYHSLSLKRGVTRACLSHLLPPQLPGSGQGPSRTQHCTSSAGLGPAVRCDTFSHSSCRSYVPRECPKVESEGNYSRYVLHKSTVHQAHYDSLSHAALHIRNEGTVKVVLVLQCTFWSVTCKVWDIFNALLPSLSKLQLHMLHTLLPPFH